MQTSLKSIWRFWSRHSREPRLAIHTSLSYRQAGEKAWHGGTAQDVSLSGVLFRAEQPMDIGTRVEIHFREPVDIGEEAGNVISCRGEIVRTILPPTKDTPPALAAKVFEPRFKPRPMFEVRKYVGDDRGPMGV
jgi:hypothetical protein